MKIKMTSAGMMTSTGSNVSLSDGERIFRARNEMVYSHPMAVFHSTQYLCNLYSLPFIWKWPVPQVPLGGVVFYQVLTGCLEWHAH